MDPTEYAEVWFDKQARQWQIAAGDKPLADEEGVPRHWRAFSAALDARDEHNNSRGNDRGWGHYC